MRHRLTLLALLVPLAAVLLAPEASAQKPPKLQRKWHEDTVNGFRFKPFDEWNQVPPKPGEEISLCTYNTDIIDHKEYVKYEGTIEVVKILPRGPETGGDDEEIDPSKLTKEELQRRMLEKYRSSSIPKTFAELVERRYGKDVAKELKGKKGKYGKVPSTEYEYEVNSRGGATYWHLAVVFQLTDFELGLIFTVPDLDDRPKKWKRTLQRCAKTFEVIEREVEEEEGAESASDFEKKKAALEKQYESMPEWRVETSKCNRYIILIHNEDPDFVREVRKRITAIRDVMEEEYPPLPGKPITAVSILRVCASRGEYSQYGGPPGSAGYWSSGHEELVIYDDKNINRNNTWGTLNHEAFHQYIFYRCGEIAPHSWFNEGTGDFYAGYKLKGSRFKVGKFDWRLGTVKEAMRVAKEGGKGGRAFVPLKDLVHYSQGEYYSNPQVCYSLGWAFVYFLKAGSRSSRFPDKWKRILPTYLEVITETKDQDKANEAAFEGFTDEDWEELQEAWVNYRW